ncbi:SLC13 family permease [Glaciimonas sp. Gout2]|uniref:SLC13 family permease n=1 Tax=unclassified Glaciimonas TaxID=2644401 RepID=UPI002AB43A04|nr:MULTISPECIES: SLC13 family permease [unclassified Glaciimonas]MDY7548667.1 SLC13 family permease [Glaciimonas sp. CA11.2]MEB0014341.1 SLC13 family permease [Glaciimonas sp. Cout2]MEB0083766.1 SLC13 family permease [Glaciimonas sp. Gout2]
MTNIIKLSTTSSLFATLFETLRKDYFFLILFVILLILSAIAPEKIQQYPHLVDWPTIATLTGLLALTKGVELSGYLSRLGRHLTVLMPTERALAVFLVLATAFLSMLLTNDVGLFVMVPLTLSLRTTIKLPITRLIIFEALAANAGSALTPIGNPQNLFLWQLSHLSFQDYVIAMLPMVCIFMIPLVLLTVVAFPGLKLMVEEDAAMTPINKKLLLISLAMYVPFLIMTDRHYAAPALLMVLAIFLFAQRNVVARIDWALLLVFILMFVDLRLVAQLPIVHALVESVGLAESQRLYLAGIVASQFISNVPAAILLAEYSGDWRLIAFGVNVGGFGFMLGSLANIIALRMTPDKKAWITFHVYSIPFLLVVAALVYVWLFL